MDDDLDDRVARLPLALGESGVDPFGLDPSWIRRALPLVAFLHRKYFRTEVTGTENVPDGRVLIVANHSGQIPIDGALITASMLLDAEPPRFLRAMVEKWTQTLPFVATLFPRVGQVVGDPENARRLLLRGEALLIFPEGSRGISKTFDQRYRLTDFGLGFMRLAIETQTPIVCVSVIGGEEQYVSIGNLSRVARALGMPSFPILPQLLVPGGQLPLPTKYRIQFDAPLHFDGDADDDDAIIEDKVAIVRARIQSLLNRGLRDRKHVFY